MPEIVDPLHSVVPPVGPPKAQSSVPVLNARRAFSTAQGLLAGEPLAGGQTLDVGWYGSAVDPENGSFAVIAQGSGLEVWLNRTLLVAFGDYSVYVVAVRVVPLPSAMQLALTRRARLALTRPSIDVIECFVQAVAS